MDGFAINEPDYQDAQKTAHGTPGISNRLGSPPNRDPSPSESLFSCSLSTLSGDSSPRSQNGGPEYAIPGRHGYLTPEGPMQYDYDGLSVRNGVRVAMYNRQNREFHANYHATSASPLMLSAEPTPAPSPAPYGGHLSPQWTHAGSAPAYAHSTTDSGSESVYPRSTTHSRSGSGSPDARSATHSGTESLYARSAGYSNAASPVYAASAYYSDSASLYAGSATTSRASSAGLTPEPEQRFQCPDCSYDFGSRDILNMHLAGQYRVGHCPGPH